MGLGLAEFSSRPVDVSDVGAEKYLYIDETGTLDFESRPGEAYFGIGTACYVGNHQGDIWVGFKLRTELEAKGVQLLKGFHSKNDSHATRLAVYQLIALQNVRFDVTMLRKANDDGALQLAGKVKLYRSALWLHLERVIALVSNPGDKIYVIVGNLQTSGHREAIRQTVEDVCKQLSFDRVMVPCIWEAPSAWGIQAIDYALWAVQREVEGKSVPEYCGLIADNIKSQVCPWG